MKTLLWNVLLALTWAMATGEFSLANVAFGFGLGYLVLLFAGGAAPPTQYFRKVPQTFMFALFYLWQLVRSNLRVAHDILTPTHYMQPGVLAVELDAVTDDEITLLANLITLTPGTLSLDVSAEANAGGSRRVLFIHDMYIDHNDIEAAKRRVKNGIERRVLQVLR